MLIGSMAAAVSIGLMPGDAQAQLFARLRERREQRCQHGDEAQTDAAATVGLEAFGGPGSAIVTTLAGVWQDPARANRAIPWKLYLPVANARLPVAIYSHGGGGTRESGAMFGEHLASHEIASLHVQHLGSDRDAFKADRQQISAAARNPQLGAPRFADILFAARMLRGEDPGLARRVDGGMLAIYGHSFGAITAQIAAGQWVTGLGRRFAVTGLRAAALLSPSPPRDDYGTSRKAFAQMNAPLLHLTGSKDDAPNGDFLAQERLVPFNTITNVPQRLLFLDGANHFTFGGDPDPRLGRRSFAYPGLARHHALIRTALTAHLRGVLLGDQAAQSYLDANPDLLRQLSNGDRFAVRGD
jgi:predicted dienelactone hydrolase